MRDVPHHSHKANYYASGPLDRADRLRADDEAVRALLHKKSTRIVPVWNGRHLVTFRDEVEAVWLNGDTPLDAIISGAGASGTDMLQQALVFLGLDARQRPYFALDLSHHEEPPTLADGIFEDLRKVGLAMDEDSAAILVYARALLIWHARHRFCGTCGSPTRALKGGHERRCENEACGHSHFPRTDPAVIMLVHDGKDRAVLGRQANWPAGRMSVLAGFVEPGESLEDAVAREVMEEVGLPVTDVRYHSSQPWPFPSSIMLGFTARATTFDLNPDFDEIEQARWVTRAEVAGPEDARDFLLSSEDSISRRLIEDWAHGEI